MNQTTATLMIVVVGMMFYWCSAMFGQAKCKMDDLVWFAFRCTGFIAGLFAAEKAIHFAKQGDGTAAVYIGIFGVAVALMSLQKMIETVRALFSKRKKHGPSSDAQLK